MQEIMVHVCILNLTKIVSFVPFGRDGAIVIRRHAVGAAELVVALVECYTVADGAEALVTPGSSPGPPRLRFSPGVLLEALPRVAERLSISGSLRQ